MHSFRTETHPLVFAQVLTFPIAPGVRTMHRRSDGYARSIEPVVFIILHHLLIVSNDSPPAKPRNILVRPSPLR